MVRFFVSLSVLAAGCGTSGATTGTARDPFAPQPDTSEGLTNVSSDLMALLEGGSLRGACDAYWAAVDAGTDTRRTPLSPLGAW
jgi:hypothetical protein